MIREMNPELKKLQNLYSWSWFYQHNRLHNDYNKVQKEISTLQEKFKYKKGK